MIVNIYIKKIFIKQNIKKMKIMIFYRYIYHLSGGYGKDMEGEIIPSIFPPDINILCCEYNLIKETSKGYWISYMNTNVHRNDIWKKWIPKNSKKRYAYPTKEEAKNNFILRNKSRLKILKSQISTVKSLLRMCETFNFN